MEANEAKPAKEGKRFLHTGGVLEANNRKRVLGRSKRIKQGKKHSPAPEAVVLYNRKNVTRVRPWRELSLVVPHLMKQSLKGHKCLGWG